MEVHSRLMRDPRVRRAEQQRAKPRSKRDLLIKRGPSNAKVILDDEKWPHMWYLVCSFHVISNFKNVGMSEHS